MSGCSESLVTELPEPDHDVTTDHAAVASRDKEALDQHLTNLVAITRSALSNEGQAGGAICTITEGDRTEGQRLRNQVDKLANSTDLAAIKTVNSELNFLLVRIYRACPVLKDLQKATEAMFADVPGAAHLDVAELNRLINDAFAVTHKQDPCEELCAAAAVLEIGIVEAAWVLAMGGCAGSLLGYPVCAGIATGIKYAAIALIGVNLAQCLEECEEDDPPPARSLLVPWKQSNQS